MLEGISVLVHKSFQIWKLNCTCFEGNLIKDSGHVSKMKACRIILYYLTLYTFSFEINESRLSDRGCLIQDVVSPHCGDKRMARRCTRRSLPNYFDMTSYHWNVRQNTVTWRWWMNGKNNVTSYTKCSLPQSIVHILFQPCYLFKIRFYWNVK
jgi:hypothetical protein